MLWRPRSRRAVVPPASLDANRLLSRATAGAVLVVAAIAAVISYQHIQHLAITHGQTRLSAALLPISIDGTVAAASLVMLHAARAGLSTLVPPPSASASSCPSCSASAASASVGRPPRTVGWLLPVCARNRSRPVTGHETHRTAHNPSTWEIQHRLA